MSWSVFQINLINLHLHTYEGPYTVVCKNQSNGYILRDETDVLMTRAYTIMNSS